MNEKPLPIPDNAATLMRKMMERRRLNQQVVGHQPNEERRQRRAREKEIGHPMSGRQWVRYRKTIRGRVTMIERVKEFMGVFNTPQGDTALMGLYAKMHEISTLSGLREALTVAVEQALTEPAPTVAEPPAEDDGA